MRRSELEAEKTIAKDFKTISSLVGNKLRIELEIISRVQCSTCEFDPVKKTSTDIKCPACGGSGYTGSSKRLIIPGFVESKGREEDHDPSGVTTRETLRVYIERSKYLLFKHLLRRKYRLRINNEQYEIVSREDAGIYRQDFILFICHKVEGI